MKLKLRFTPPMSGERPQPCQYECGEPVRIGQTVAPLRGSLEPERSAPRLKPGLY